MSVNLDQYVDLNEIVERSAIIISWSRKREWYVENAKIVGLMAVPLLPTFTADCPQSLGGSNDIGIEVEVVWDAVFHFAKSLL